MRWGKDREVRVKFRTIARLIGEARGQGPDPAPRKRRRHRAAPQVLLALLRSEGYRATFAELAEAVEGAHKHCLDQALNGLWEAGMVRFPADMAVALTVAGAEEACRHMRERNEREG